MRQRTALILTFVAGVVGCIPDHNPDRRVAAHIAPTPSVLADGAVTAEQPHLGVTIRQSDPPPPLSGGTIAVTNDGETVVAADPDRDRVYVIDIRAPAKVRTIALAKHDEPGRVAIDDSNRAHVVLRGAGSVLTIDLTTGSIVARREVCPAPRGIAVEHSRDAGDVVHVACAGGDLVTLPPEGGPELRRRFVARDLRDVAVMPGWLALTTFRDGQVLQITSGSDTVGHRSLPRSPVFGIPRVAWRMIAAPRWVADGHGHGLLVAAQRAPDPDDDGPPPPKPALYYEAADCQPSGPAPVVHDGSESIIVPNAVLPVDIAANEDTLVVVAAANAHTPGQPQLVIMTRQYDQAASPPNHHFWCAATSNTSGPALAGLQITSVAFANRTTIVALSREPAVLVVLHAGSQAELSRIALADESREDTGHAIFHSNSGAGAACASCHPDGHDDGHAWLSQELGPRRTPSLLGTVANTAPYHWNGEAKDMAALMKLTFESAMHGPPLAPDQIDAIDGWLRALPPPTALPPRDAAAAQRGRAFFETPVTCARCHSGAMKTNNTSRNVGTGGEFQVPSLVGVGWRAPYLHDGSAATLGDVLARGHAGFVLDAARISDLTMYLETL